MMNWLFRHPGKINAFFIALNFWFAATNFEKGGYWLVLSAVHVATCLLIAHFQLKAMEINKEWEVKREEREEIIRMLEALERDVRKI